MDNSKSIKKFSGTESIESKSIKSYFNVSHYSTILDENLDILKLKEEIGGIFSENFDIFFSDFYPEEIGGKIDSYKSEIRETNNGFLVLGLDKIEINFDFKEYDSLKSINVDFKFPMEKLDKKQELYIETIIGYLKCFGLDLNFNENFTNKQISCKNGVCSFISDLKGNFERNKNEKEINILEYLKAENWAFIDQIYDDLDNVTLRRKLVELKNFKNNIFGKDLEDKEVQDYNNLKLDIIFDITSQQYKQLISTIDSYILSIENEISEKTSQQVFGILESDSFLNKDDKIVFLQVKTILEEYKKIYLEKLELINQLLKSEKQKKDLLKLSVNLGNELPIIIKEIEKEIPLFTKIKHKIQGLLSNKNDEEDTLSNKNEIIDQKKEQFLNIAQYIKLMNNINDRDLAKFNYQLFFSGFICFFVNDEIRIENKNYNEVNLVNKADGLYLKHLNQEYKILTIINGDIILELNDIEEKFGDIIDRNRFKFINVFDPRNKEIKKEIYDTKNNKVSNKNIGSFTGKYVDIGGLRFVQENKKNYINLDTFLHLRIKYLQYYCWVIEIDMKNPVIIKGEKYFQLKINNESKKQELLVKFDNIKIDKYGYVQYNKIYEGRISNIVKINEYEYYILKTLEGIKHIEKETGEILEEKIPRKIEEKYGSNLWVRGEEFIKKILFKDDFIEVYTKDEQKHLFDGNNFLEVNGKNLLDLEEIIFLGEKFFNAKILNDKNEVVNVVLNHNKELINLSNGTENRIDMKLTGKSLNYNGNIYQEILLDNKNYFINLNQKKLFYHEEDIFLYEQNGKSYKVIDGTNKQNILELKLIDETGKITYVSLEDNLRKGFFNKVLDFFN